MMIVWMLGCGVRMSKVLAFLIQDSMEGILGKVGAGVLMLKEVIPAPVAVSVRFGLIPIVSAPWAKWLEQPNFPAITPP